jgi:hypothetical protein
MYKKHAIRNMLVQLNNILVILFQPTKEIKNIFKHEFEHGGIDGTEDWYVGYQLCSAIIMTEEVYSKLDLIKLKSFFYDKELQTMPSFYQHFLIESVEKYSLDYCFEIHAIGELTKLTEEATKSLQ